jgi:two-component system, OmpR family, response regulator
MNDDHDSLPRPPWPAAQASTTMDRRGTAGRSGRILVVDDDAGVREILAEFLRAAGHDVACAEDGEAGWETLCAERFDVLITDHEMPRLSGVGLLRRVRAGQRQLPVIVLSGQMPWDEADFLQLLSPGVALEKPFTWAELLARVRDFLAPTARAGRARSGMVARRAHS